MLPDLRARTNGRYCANQTIGVIVKASTVTAASRRTIGALWSGKIPANRGKLPAQSMLRAGPIANGSLAFG